MYVCPLNRDIYIYIYIYKVHPRTVLLLSAARPSINLTFSCKVFYSSFFLCKTDLQSSNYLKNRRGYASLTTIVFVRHLEMRFRWQLITGAKCPRFLAMDPFSYPAHNFIDVSVPSFGYAIPRFFFGYLAAASFYKKQPRLPRVGNVTSFWVCKIQN